MAIPKFIRYSTDKGQTWHDFPQPARPLNMQIATIVDSSRNANGVVVGQKVGRDQQKIDGLFWAHLTAAQWAAILAVFDQHFFLYIKYPNMVTGTWTVREMYCGDRSAEPLWLNLNENSTNAGLPTDYINCKVNLIDTGKNIVA